MSDIKLFRIAGKAAVEIQGAASHLEKPLQTLIEANLENLLGVRFLQSEHPTGKVHAGRIDTLGLDENNCPVIIEYKRSTGENIITQGLFYLDWLLDHRAEFEMLAAKRFGKACAESVDWSSPRLLCIAADFTKYDSHAAQQMAHSVELIRYRQFGKDLLLLELVNAVAPEIPSGKKNKKAKGTGTDKTTAEWFADMSEDLRALFDSLEGYATSLGDDVQRKDLKLYVAFKRIRNFVCVCFKTSALQLYLRLDPTRVPLVEGFTRDVRKTGHWGTGDLEVTIKSLADLDRAKPLIQQSYEGGVRAG